MRLRYLHLQALPPLADIEIIFHHETVLNRQCAIRFVVGVNGSGKTRLLQAIVEVLRDLKWRQLRREPVTLAYDLTTSDGTRTVYLHHPGDPNQIVLIEFAQRLADDTDWSRLVTSDWEKPPYLVRNSFLNGSLPGEGQIDRLLPGNVLVYSSGATDAWEKLFASEYIGDLPPLEFFDAELERPTGWTEQRELERQRRVGDEISEPGEANTNTAYELDAGDLRTAPFGMLMLPLDLRLSVCAVALEQAAADFAVIPLKTEAEDEFSAAISAGLARDERAPGLRGLLNVVDWLWPLTLSITIDFRPEQLIDPQPELLKRIYQVATSVLCEPGGGSGRILFFDLRRPTTFGQHNYPSTAAALFEALGVAHSQERAISAMDVYRNLRELHRGGILHDVALLIRKRITPDLILFENLSDGERFFLGRMALFHLLRGETNALVILDEPETHFNDLWKREIVNIIDERLRDNPSEVIISTHSSIALSDVFDSEITLLKKAPNDGTVEAVRTPIRTFGASPSEIMIYIFDAPETVGKRATEFLDMILMLAAYSNDVQTLWELDAARANGTGAMREHPAFTRLMSYLADLPHDYGTAEERANLLAETLRAFREYTERMRHTAPVKVAEAVTILQELLGPGYYQFEFRRRLRALREPNSDAPQH
jgi:ABC-type transport system involved in cytochrome c biogenesis ATPase subunit